MKIIPQTTQFFSDGESFSEDDSPTKTPYSKVHDKNVAFADLSNQNKQPFIKSSTHSYKKGSPER